MAVVCRLFDKVDPDVHFRLDRGLHAAVGSWKDFAGNSCHFLFTPDGAAILGFDHDSPMSPHATAAQRLFSGRRPSTGHDSTATHSGNMLVKVSTSVVASRVSE